MTLSKQPAVAEPRKKTRVATVPDSPTTKSALDHCHEYGRERPGMVALWCLGIGFVLGWKFKLW